MKNVSIKKLTATLLILSLGVFAYGCGASPSSGGSTSSQTADSQSPDAQASDGTQTETEAQDLLAQIKERGEITIAMEGTWAPWTYHDEDDKLVGFDVGVGEAIAEHLGVSAKFVEGEWDGLLAGLEAGRYDIMINGVDVTPEREEKFTFSEPYAYNKTAVIVRSDDTAINSMEDLEGKSTANTISSTYAEVAEKYGATVTGVDDLNQTMELLLTGRIDATLNAEVTFYDYMAAHPEAEVKIATLDPDATSVAIPMRKGPETEELAKAVNEALSKMREDGTLKALSEEYFNTDITEPVD